MAVFVDDFYLTKMGSYRSMKMSHMAASSDEELHEMARKIGVDRRHWQSDKNHRLSHYDICMSKRNLALKNGAIAVTWRQMGVISRFFKTNGKMPLSLEEAVSWWGSLKGK